MRAAARVAFLPHDPFPVLLLGGGGLIESQAKAAAVARAALDRHAEDVLVLDLRGLSSVTDFFVLCTAGSARQINALKEHVEAALRQEGAVVGHTEGAATASVDSPQWVLMDCGDVVVHLFDARSRAFYGLERLWADAPRVSPDA